MAFSNFGLKSKVNEKDNDFRYNDVNERYKLMNRLYDYCFDSCIHSIEFHYIF